MSCYGTDYAPATFTYLPYGYLPYMLKEPKIDGYIWCSMNTYNDPNDYGWILVSESAFRSN